MDAFFEMPGSIFYFGAGQWCVCLYVCMCILVFYTLPSQLYMGLYGYVLPAEEIGSKQRSF